MSVAEVGEVGRWVRNLYLVAMAVFLVTIVIGIVNGLDLYEFDRNQLLTHVHSGTLGWITLGIVASAMWLTRAADRRLAISLAILIPIYVAAFYFGNLAGRALTGVALLIAVLWVFVWIWRATRGGRSLPGLAVALGLTTFTYGAIIGVLFQVQLATQTVIFPAGSDVVGAHASTMVFSYLILAAMGFIEWQTKGTSDRPRAGVVQLAALFLGGIVLSGALLFLPAEALQAAGGLDLLLELTAVVLFVVRVLPAAVRTDWLVDSGRRYFAASALFVLVATAIFMYLVSQFIQNPDTSAIPTGLIIASDHAAFIGVMTNLLFGLVLTLSADRVVGPRWLREVVFWAINIGLAIFLVGLVADSAEIKRIGAPIMGTAILIGVAMLATRLRASDVSAVEA